jgi:hypothetical protein
VIEELVETEYGKGSLVHLAWFVVKIEGLINFWALWQGLRIFSPVSRVNGFLDPLAGLKDI